MQGADHVTAALRTGGAGPDATRGGVPPFAPFLPVASGAAQAVDPRTSGDLADRTQDDPRLIITLVTSCRKDNNHGAERKSQFRFGDFWRSRARHEWRAIRDPIPVLVDLRRVPAVLTPLSVSCFERSLHAVRREGFARRICFAASCCITAVAITMPANWRSARRAQHRS